MYGRYEVIIWTFQPTPVSLFKRNPLVFSHFIVYFLMLSISVDEINIWIYNITKF